MKKCLTVVLIAVVMLANCSKDSSVTPDEKETSKPLAFTNNGSRVCCVILHSSNGSNIEQIYEMQPGDHLDLSDYEKDYVSFSLLLQSSTLNSTNYTYYDVPTNTFAFAFGSPITPTETTRKESVVNIDTGTMLNYSSTGVVAPNTYSWAFGFNGGAGYDWGFTVSFDPDCPKMLYAAAIDVENKLGKYGILNVDALVNAQTDTLTVVLDKDLRRHDLKTSMQTIKADLSTLHRLPGGNYYSLMHGIWYSYNPSTSISIYDAKEIKGDMYNISLSGDGWNYDKRCTSIPTEIKIPEGHISATEIKNGVDNIALIGDFDAVELVCRQDMTTSYQYWYAYAPAKAKTISIPVLPDSLYSKMGVRKIINPTVYLQAYNYSALESYGDYVQYRLSPSLALEEQTIFTASKSFAGPMAKKQTSPQIIQENFDPADPFAHPQF